jgi:serine phosphatase RsbU (regulator of sigma subunit)
MRILIADDSATSRHVLRRTLEGLGHECIVAEDGRDAWAQFQAEPVEMVVSDWVMPGLSGEELCRRIRGLRGVPYTYFVLLTSLEDTEHALRGMQAGADDYLTKPLDPKELAMRLIAASRVTELHTRLRAQQQELEREIETAASVQRGLLPDRAPEMPGITLDGRCVPASNVGGDYYDHFVDPQGRLVLLIADVAGHSIGSALMMAMLRSVVRPEIMAERSPAEVLHYANRAMFADLVTAELFITAFCARYDTASGTLAYANAGHNPPLLHRSDSAVEMLDADGVALGILADVEYEEKSVPLQGDDLLLLYTDGVVEASATDGRQFGESRLKQLVAARNGSGPSQLLDSVQTAVSLHAVGTRQQDDITLLAVLVGDRESGGADAS